MTFKLLMDSTAVDPEVHLNMTTTQRDLATRLEEEQQPAGEMTEQQPGEQIADKQTARSEEHTSELQSPAPNSYAVFCLKIK